MDKCSYWGRNVDLIRKQNDSLSELKCSDVTVAKHYKLPCPPLNSHRTYSTHSSIFSVATVRSPSGLPKADFNGLHFKAGMYCTKMTTDRG